ncbi:MAG: heavy metal translocating P-type ATPase [Gammaproteobacteria bacterium]
MPQPIELQSGSTSNPTIDKGHCFHCGLPTPPGNPYSTDIAGQPRAFCCPGCQAVCRAIHEAGLEGFYRRTSEETPLAPPPEAPRDLAHFDLDAVQAEYVDELGDVRAIHLLVEGIHCAACVWLIERALERLPGVLQVNVNLAERRLHLRWDNRVLRLSQALARLAEIGYAAVPFDPETAEGALRRRNRAMLYRLAFAGFTMMNLLWISVALYTGADEGEFRGLFHWVGLGLATPTLFYSGWPFLAGAWRGIRSRHLSMDLPIALGASVTYGYSVFVTLNPDHGGEVYFDTVVNFLFVILVGRYLEAISRQKAVASAQRLVDLQPKVATVIRDGEEQIVPIRAVAIGEPVLVRAGDTLPVDGVVVEGSGAVNEAMLTGESAPVRKKPGDRVAAGTINLSGALTVKTEALLNNSALGRIIRMVEDAQASRAPIQCTADRIVPWFIAVTLGLATLTFLYWVNIDFDTALLAATAVLIITCPCAFGLATPMAVAVASGLGARHGILVKSGTALETLSRIDHLVLDKTGTATTGSLSVVATEWLNDGARFLDELASLERLSEHTIGRAIVEHARSQGCEIRHLVTDFMHRPGLGISGRVNGVNLAVGSAAWMRELGVRIPESLKDRMDEYESYGKSCVFGARNGNVIGLFALADGLRPETAPLVAALQAQGITVSLLTGDRQAVADSVARQLGGIEAIAEVLPEDKAKRIKELQNQGHCVAMVGDGVNDAPALVQADVGIALASGTDVSAASADVVLVGNHLDQIRLSRALATRTLRTIRQNIGLSLTYNVLLVPAAMAALVTPLVAAIAMPISSLLVVGNAARIRTLFREGSRFSPLQPKEG